MKGHLNFRALREKYWPPKKDQLLILVLLGLLLAVIAVPVEPKGDASASSDLSAEETENQAEALAAEDYGSRMEARLEDLLSQVEGVGKAKVLLTFAGTGEKMVEKDREISAETSREETVYAEYGSSERTPYVTSETNPKVEGILVIAEGGADSRVQEEIIEAAEALFGIEPHKIKIMKMEGSK